MSSAVRESSTTHTSRKIVSHGGPISGQTHVSATANSLENNLDALLEDLQTSVSRSATPSGRGGRALSPQIEHRMAANPTRVITETRTISPTRSTTTTTEKYVSTGPAGTASNIPGLEFIDRELQNVHPGQSKTVAYKQVSYQYNKSLDGKAEVETWDNVPLAAPPLIDETREISYEEERAERRHRSPEPVSKKSTVSRELLFNDSSTSLTRQTSPPPPTQHRDVKYIHESTSYQAEPRAVTTTVKTNAAQEYGSVDYVPVPSPTPAVPINLAPGPNTKVTTTIKTYTYELPGSPETYLPGGSLPQGVVLPGDQTITYTLPRGGGTTVDKTVTYQTVTSPQPPEITKKSTTLHKEAKFYREEHVGGVPSGPGQPTQPTTVVYHAGPPPPGIESKTTVTRNEKYYQVDGQYPNGHGPNDRPDYSGSPTYQNQLPPTMTETRTTTIDRVEEHYPNRPPSNIRNSTLEKPGTPTRPIGYYTSSPQSPPQSSTTIYKYSNTTTTIPPNKYPDDHEVLLPKPFPTRGVQVYPSKPATNGEGPPKKLEDLMASFSDTEREVLEDIERQEKQQRQKTESPAVKKEVDFVPHTPPQVQSKNVAGPPVYYPPGSAEFTKKEESMSAMSQSGGGWQKAKGKYEYEASSKSKSKSSSGGAVVPVCLPLCCAMPCTIM